MADRIDTVAARKALAPRPAPYFQRLEVGGFIGFRKLLDGTGSWVVRWRNDNSKQINETLGTFDTYDLACKAARDWIEHAKGGVTEQISVEEACKRYVSDRNKEKGKATAQDADGRFKRLVYGKQLGKLKLSALKTAHITDWRNSIADTEDDDDDPDAERRAKDTANRYLATLKAALNLAYRMGLVASTAQWDRVSAFKSVGRRRDRFLTLVERKMLLTAAPPDLQKLIKSLLQTGARVGEMASAKVRDLDETGLLAVDGKVGRRIVPLSPETCRYLLECAGNRRADEPLLARENGEAWTRYYWRDLFQITRKAAGFDDDVVMYSLRHCAITEMIVSGIDALSVARITGTSIAMIQNHYGHLMKDKVTNQLAKVRMV